MSAPAHQLRRKPASFQIEEVGLLVESFQAAPVRCVQTSRGELGARIHDVSTQRVELRDSGFKAGVTATVPDPVDRLILGIGLSGEASLQGVRLTNSNLSYLSGRNGAIAVLAPGSRWCNLSFDWELLHSIAETHNYRVPRGDNFCGMPVREHKELAWKLSRIAREEIYTDLSDTELEDELALTILRLINPQIRRDKTQRNNRQCNVHRVIDFIEARFGESITLTELCQLTGVSERTLQYQFKDATGISIQRFLMNYRLQRARALLIRGEFTQVGEVATACGFHHMGRFAQYYKTLFGQSPREIQASL